MGGGKIIPSFALWGKSEASQLIINDSTIFLCSICAAKIQKKLIRGGIGGINFEGGVTMADYGLWLTMAHGSWPMACFSLFQEIADQVRNDTLGEAGHRL